MRIDLHCHTKSTKKGDGSGRNVTPELFREKIELADVKIVAITNHNAFDINQYNMLKETVADICQVWPGIELDVQVDETSKNKFHLIIICNPEKSIQFDEQVKKLFFKNTGIYYLSDICEKFSQCDVIYMPHFHNKKPAISEEDRLKLISIVGDASRVFTEPRDHRTLGVLANNNFNAMIGSDVKDWSKYEECTFTELRLPIGSFLELILLAKRDSKVVKTLLDNKPSISLICKPHESVNLRIEIYPDINIIFGQKGTGKTAILNSIYDEMCKIGKKCIRYIASERTDVFSQLLSTKGIEVDLKKLSIDSCENEFQLIKNWKDTNPTNLSDYINWICTRGNSNNKARMKITEAIHERFIASNTYEIHQTDNYNISSILDSLHNIKLEEYISSIEIEQLQGLISTLKENIYEKRKSDVIDEESVTLTNWSIDKIKSIADRNSDTVSRPSKSGLYDFASRRLNLYIAINKILDFMNNSEHNERNLIGILEDKGKIFVNTKYRMLCSDSKKIEFRDKITILKEIKKLLENILDDIFAEDIGSKVNKLNEICSENSISSIKPFVGISKQVITEDELEYSPSNGEKGILILQKTLNDEADAYFLDEPELGMGNSYIDANIRPLISGLAKQRKFIIVATHNANIAVRTLPYVSIFRMHDNGKYKTYVGNPFDDKLVNLEDNHDIKSWIEESILSLEGSREAFYERRDIYESKDS